MFVSHPYVYFLRLSFPSQLMVPPEAQGAPLLYTVHA